MAKNQRIAFISDIHGNLVSLEAVLADIETQHVDQTICLGDVADLGPQPLETLRRIRALDIPCIMGNHDYFSLNIEALATYSDVPWVNAMHRWCSDLLNDDDRAFIRSFKDRHTIRLDAQTDILCFHGTPRSNTEFLLTDTPAENVSQMIDRHNATVMVGGHTHIQMIRQHNGTLIVNAGSVGMPYEKMPFHPTPRFLPWAEYAILTYNNGAIGAELRRVPIDFEAVIQTGKHSTMPDINKWVTDWITPADYYC